MAFIWQVLTIYTKNNGKFIIESRCWHNYQDIKNALVSETNRDAKKEEKIYKSIWH